MKKTAYKSKHKAMAGMAAVGLAAALAVPVAAYGADAPVLGWGNNANARGCGAACIGTDGNGVCDRFADADGNGVCDNRGIHAAHSAFTRGFAAFGECGRAFGANFVDEDGDGLCDRREAGQGVGSGQGFADGFGYGAGNGQCGGQGYGAGRAACYGHGHGLGNGGGHHGVHAR